MSKIIELHKFFVKETPKFVGKWHWEKWTTYWGFGNTVCYGRYKLPLKEKLYYPIAYLKFMYYSLKD